MTPTRPRPGDRLAPRPPAAELADARAEADAHLDPPAGPGEATGALADWLETPLGPMLAVADGTGLRLLEFPERAVLSAEFRRLRSELGPVRRGHSPMLDRVRAVMEAYFEDPAAPVDLPLAPLGPEFQRGVWAELRRIPSGVAISYGELARRIGRPTASRAVAAANGANPIAILIPCHRVIGADGSLTGYGGGLWRKRALLAHEAILAGPGRAAGLDPEPLLI